MASVRTAAIDLLWSIWAELGVPAGGRRHQAIALDPEPIIAWTPHLAADEPRLLGLAFDWCVANAAHVAKVRITGLAKLLPETAKSSLSHFNGALRQNGVDWLPSATPAELDVGRARVAAPLDRPALVRLRLGVLCGASIRADVLARLLASAERAAQVTDLTPAGVTRRSVERVLGDLAASNFVSVEGGKRRRAFRLREHEALVRLVRAEGLHWSDWHLSLSLTAALVQLESTSSLSAGVRHVEAAREHARLDEWALRAGLKAPPGPVEREDLADALIAWGATQVASL